MDVLVQVTTENGINAGGMILKVPIDRPPGYLHYKPNMPIGKLGCTTVEVVPKAAVCDRPRKHAPKGPNLPFEVRTLFCFVTRDGRICRDAYIPSRSRSEVGRLRYSEGEV